jgi:hypothetical protein
MSATTEHQFHYPKDYNTYNTSCTHKNDKVDWSVVFLALLGCFLTHVLLTAIVILVLATQ